MKHRVIRTVPSALVRAVVGVPAVAGVLLVAAGPPATAGGWGISRLDDLPRAPVAGEEIRIGFTFLQHGENPRDLLADSTSGDGDVPVGVTVAPAGADLDADGTFFPAEPGTDAGHHLVDVEFPEPGRYTWRVEQGGFPPHDLGEIDVGQNPDGPVAGSGGAREDAEGAGPAVTAARVAAPVVAGLALVGAVRPDLWRRRSARDRASGEVAL